MAEEPCLLTTLLYEKRYAEFLATVQSYGLLQVPPARLEEEIAKLHASLGCRRHPPGPTVEWMAIDHLIEKGVLSRKTREYLRP